MRRSLLLCLLMSFALGQSSPPTMTKLVVRLESADIPKDSFAAQPKTFYRAGNRYCRIEEEPDTEHGIHGLIIINEPDIWLVNRLTKTAQHQVDSGPTFNCQLPIFAIGKDAQSALDKNNPLMELEFGRELAYFIGKKAETGSGPVLQGKHTKAYITKAGDSSLFLFTSGAPEQPVAVVHQHGATRDTFWYGSYEEIPFDPSLFAKPDGVKIENAK